MRRNKNSKIRRSKIKTTTAHAEDNLLRRETCVEAENGHAKKKRKKSTEGMRILLSKTGQIDVIQKNSHHVIEEDLQLHREATAPFSHGVPVRVRLRVIRRVSVLGRVTVS